MTPNALRYAAIAVLASLLMGLLGDTVEPINITNGCASGVTYAATLCTLLVFPRTRSSDLVAFLAAAFSIDGMIQMVFADHVNIMRWLSMLAGSGAVILPLRIRDIRSLAAANGQRSFADWATGDPRNGGRLVPNRKLYVENAYPADQRLRSPDGVIITYE
jgi:hypothetical protein